MTDRRFQPFTDRELAELWDGLTMDDGIRYGLPDRPDEEGDNTEPFWLVVELHEEAALRGLVDTDEQRWANVT